MRTEDMLGRRARDKVSGFEGTVTAFLRYITGCDRVALQPDADGEGKLASEQWFDVTRLEVDPEAPVVFEVERDAMPSLPRPLAGG